jgi:hypothetical protein
LLLLADLEPSTGTTLGDLWKSNTNMAKNPCMAKVTRFALLLIAAGCGSVRNSNTDASLVPTDASLVPTDASLVPASFTFTGAVVREE